MEQNKNSKTVKKALWLLVGIPVVAVVIMLGIIVYNKYVNNKEVTNNKTEEKDNNRGTLYICSYNEDDDISINKNHSYSFTDESNSYQDCEKSNITFEKDYSLIKEIETEKIVVLENDNKLVFFDYKKNEFVHEFTMPKYDYLTSEIELYINENTWYTYGFSISYYKSDDPNFGSYNVFYDLESYDSFQMKPVKPTHKIYGKIIVTDNNRLIETYDINCKEKLGLYNLKQNMIIFENKYDAVYPVNFDVAENNYYAAKNVEENKSLVYFIESKQKIEIPSVEFWVLNNNHIAYLENAKLYITSINNVNNKLQNLMVIEKIDESINYINFVEFEGDAPFDETNLVNNIYGRSTNYVAIDTAEGVKYYSVEENKLLFEIEYTYDN